MNFDNNKDYNNTMCLINTRGFRSQYPPKRVEQNRTPNHNTSKDGIKLESLLELSKQNAQACLDGKLFKSLRESRVGTFEVEKCALKIGRGRFGVAAKGDVENIKKNRNWTDVRPRLNIKIDSCTGRSLKLGRHT